MADINEENRIKLKMGFSCNLMNFCFKSTSGFISTQTRIILRLLQRQLFGLFTFSRHIYPKRLTLQVIHFFYLYVYNLHNFSGPLHALIAMIGYIL